MSSPKLGAWDSVQTPPLRPSSTDLNSSPSLSFVSKTFSDRHSGSTSTLASSPAPARDSFEFFGTAKGSLSQVREEAVMEHEDDVDTIGQSFFPRGSFSSYQNQIYNFDDAPNHYPSPKKARSGESPVSTPGTTISRRFGSLSQKFKKRSGHGSNLSIDLATPTSRSRNNSAGSTVLSPVIDSLSQRDSLLPPSPARTLYEESIHETISMPIDIEKANSHQEEEIIQARTPLLPPMLVALSCKQEESPVHSPLQSPSVADSCFFSSDALTPVDTPRVNSYPSPPLSTKPSVASMRQRSRAGTTVGSPLIPSADIPPMIIDTEEDEDSWSERLGHDNFVIYPQPYMPERLCLEACKQFHDDYELAKANFAQHLEQTAENCGVTSRVFKLTEEKWAEIDGEWQKSNAAVIRCVEEIAERQDAMLIDLAHSSSDSIPAPQIPATDIVTGKFPLLDDEEIVGPMTVGPALRHMMHNEVHFSKKRTFFKFLSDLINRNARV